MKHRIHYILFIVFFAVSLGATSTTAQGENPTAGEAANAVIDAVISYQGVLQEGGVAVTGSREMTFSLYSNSGCTTQVSSNIVKSGVSVSNGLFSTELTVDASHFDGQGLWLKAVVSGTDLGCQKIMPVPYALSLRPGALIRGDVIGAVISTRHTGVGPGSIGLAGEAISTTGVGVQGYASSATGGGVGVSGRSDSSGGFGVYGYASSVSGTNYGVYGISDSTAGSGVFGQGNTYGLFGKTFSGTGFGVFGYAASTSGVSTGVSGVTDSNTAWARGIFGRAAALSGQTYGVIGQSDSNTAWATGVYGYVPATSGQTVGVSGRTDSTTAWARGVYGYAAAATGATYGVIGESKSSSGVGVWGYGYGGAGGVFVSYTGDLIQGWDETSPGVSNLRFKVENDGDVYADRAYHCGVNDGGSATYSATYIDENTGCMYDNDPADFAEMLPAERDLMPGDVLIIGTDGKLILSSEPNQTNVAGVYSTRPSYLGNSKYVDNPEYAPLAMVGVVPVKVTNENGAIQPGDLLTTSSIPGVAMKANPVDLGEGILLYRPGTIIGKALEGTRSVKPHQHLA